MRLKEARRRAERAREKVEMKINAYAEKLSESRPSSHAFLVCFPMPMHRYTFLRSHNCSVLKV